MSESDSAQNFDYYLEKAVKRYQASNGLAPTGVIDKRTIAALNVPASSRLKQLKSNLARLMAFGKAAGSPVIFHRKYWRWPGYRYTSSASCTQQTCEC